MNRLEKTLNALKQQEKKALITFLTAGDPDLQTTKRHVLTMIENGADIIEIGVPFSDPVADGEEIQKANIRALEGGVNIDDVMGLMAEIRQGTEVSLIYLIYYNIILHYGLDRFFADCKKAGVDGVIIPDLPYEEAVEIEEHINKYDIIRIPLITPTSNNRIRMITQNARGFLYCVSSLGVTGMRIDFTTDMASFSKEIGEASYLPRMVGFGVSKPEHAKNLKQYFDGVIIGSAVVHTAYETGDLTNYIKEMRKALDED